MANTHYLQMGNKITLPKTTNFSGNYNSCTFKAAQLQGWRETMEDYLLTDHQEDYQIFAVFDGHGGHQVSQFLQNHFCEVFDREFHSNDGDVAQAIFRSFQKLDDIIARKVTSEQIGSTALVTVITKTFVYVANLGDCRALYKHEFGYEVLSRDHDVLNDEERILKCGGFIKDGRVNGSLLVGRAFGDYFLKKSRTPIISSIPEIKIIERPKSGDYILLASDGLWECASNEYIHKYINANINQQQVLSTLFCKMMAKDDQADVGHDNMSGLLIQF